MGTTTRRDRDRAARKDLIIQKSKELFLARGFDAVTVQDICDAIEFGRSVFYSHFQSKEEVFHHIKLEGIQLLTDSLDAIDPEAKDKCYELRKCSNIIFNFYRVRRLHYKAMFLLPVPEIPKTLEERIDQAERLAAARPVLLLKNGMGDDTFRLLSAEEMVFVYWTGLAGIINFHIQHNRETDQEQIRAYCDRYSEVFLTGIQKNSR